MDPTITAAIITAVIGPITVAMATYIGREIIRRMRREEGSTLGQTEERHTSLSKYSTFVLVSSITALVIVAVAVVAVIWFPLLCILYPYPWNNWNAQEWEVARSHVRWVLDDPQPRTIYDRARANGLPKYKAALEAQRHNPDAQQNIRWYGEVRTECCVNSLGYDWNAQEWEVARSHVRWVLDDPRPKAIYDRARDSGLPKYKAVLEAQRHNPDAQQNIRQYGKVRTERFLNSRGY